MNLLCSLPARFALGLAIIAAASPINAQTYGVYREVYTNIAGGTVANLTNAAAFPNNPGSTNFVTDLFEAPSNVLDDYGQRMRAFVLPPTTGDYIFWIATDDGGALYLSTDENPANKVLIAAELSWASIREWTKHPEQQSALIHLEAGRRYYLEALQKEGGGGDNLAVGWQLANYSFDRPITATNRLIPFTGGFTSAPVVLRQPTNTSVLEATAAVGFSVLAADTAPVIYQWQKNGTNLPGALASSITLTNLLLSDNNAIFRCILTNILGATTSSVVTLTVTADTTPPAITRVQNIGSNLVVVSYSERVDPATGTNRLNYVLSASVSVSLATFGPDEQSVYLTTSSLTTGNNYILTVNNVRDRASTPNTIAANTQVGFIATDFAREPIGNSPQSGSITNVPGGYDVVAGGAQIGGASDQFDLHYQFRTGDFDLGVRLQSLSTTDPWAEAGLMARESLDPISRFAGAFSSPSLVGTFFESRSTPGGTTSNNGSFPANYPNGWLRLKRAGSVFTGFASYDGQTWYQLGSASLTMPATLFVGLAASSHNTNQTAVAQFRNVITVSGGTISQAPPAPFEPLGPSTRKTGLVISEIMYNPTNRADGRKLEFIELFNSNPFFEDLTGYRLSGDIDFTFPPGTTLAGGAFLVVARVPSDLQFVYGLNSVFGPYTNSLKNSGTVRLRDAIDSIVLEINHGSKSPWPAGADGTGHSIVLARPSFGENDPRAWDLSDITGGSPGQVESYRPSPLRNIFINEILAHTDPPKFDRIELYNHGNQAVDLTGCIITDSATSNRFVIPITTTIPARGFLAFDENQLGFRLDAAGETVFLKSPDLSRVLDSVQFDSQENGVSFGRWPDGAPDIYRLQTPTFGMPNAAPLLSKVVINEIMYKPISGLDDDEYVELYNTGPSSADLTGWRLGGGISFNFPSNTILQSDHYLVVAKNAARLTTNYPNLTSANTLGDFSGKLSGSGDRITLTMPDDIASTNSSGIVTTNHIHIVVDEVDYRGGGRWGNWANGGGSSLELIEPRANRRLAANWADSDETGKAPWISFEATGVLDNGGTYTNGPVDNLQVMLLNEGEALLDDVEVIPGGSTSNLVVNSTFESGLGNWVVQGTHIRSTLETTEGFTGSRSLHIRASARGDTGANRIRADLATNLTVGATVTLRARARWLHGWPEILMRTRGNYLEALGRLAVPSNLGTPGARNSRALANAGPAIFSVAHSPVLPADGQPVVVTARFHDPDALKNLQVFYRIDPATTYSTITMVDDGSAGDDVAGDGIFSATIPLQTAGNLVAFYVSAADTPGITNTFPNDAPVRECLVRFGESNPASGFGAYRIWLTQSNVNQWNAAPAISNERIEGTFVVGNYRVIYNMNSKFAGSPYHQGFGSPVFNNCHYSLEMPLDDLFLGTENFNKIHAPGNGPFDDTLLQREQTAYWLVRQSGLPWNYRRFIAVYVNGNRKGGAKLMEDTQTPGSDVVDERFPDDPNGNLYKLQPWFEFDNVLVNSSGGAGFANLSWCTLNIYNTTGGEKKTARYRWNYLTRAANGTANDYTNVFSLVDAANAPANMLVPTLEAQVDMEQWLRTFAVEHSVGNWDSFGNRNAQNMYGYKPAAGKWQLLIWDYNIVLGNSGSDGPTGDNLFQYNGADPWMGRIYSTPAFRRVYLRNLKDIASGPMLANRINPIIDAKYAAFQSEALAAGDPAGLKSWIATRRDYLLSQTTNSTAAFAITNNNGFNFTVTNNLITLSGTAPLDVKSILVNGISYPPNWTSITNWNIILAIAAGPNSLSIQGLDLHGNLVTSTNITVTYSGAAALPENNIVITEIMYNPIVPGTTFIEVYNRATNFNFDLSGWELHGAGFTFPGGTILAPDSYLLVVANRDAFTSAYGSNLPIAGEFTGSLQNGGETLRLDRPLSTPGTFTTVNEVTYESSLPWSPFANGTGSSLQLIDPTQDDNRVGNWAAVPPTNGPVWRYVTATATKTVVNSPIVYFYLNGPGDLYLDDVKVVSGSVPGTGPNLVVNGDFESPLNPNWVTDANHATSTVSTNFHNSGNSSVHLIATAGSTTLGLNQNIAAVTNNGTYTLSFWFLSSTNGDRLTARFSGAWLTTNFPISGAGFPPGPAFATPGASNSIRTNLSAFATLRINEVLPENINGATNRFGAHEPWIELHNNGTNSVDLTGHFLSDTYNNLTRWAFPAGTTVAAGGFLVVWADAQAGQSIPSELHASFRITNSSGSIILTRSNSLQSVIVDYLNYSVGGADQSYGLFPDSKISSRRVLYYPTKGATNNGASLPITVLINEWMADNTAALADPADGQYEDWFELYNPTTNTVSLDGYFLTDVLTNKTKFPIPAGYKISPHGFLLVWADGEENQNSTNLTDLHASFSLSKSGEAIGLYAPDGTTIDAINFPAQTSNVSQGRYPDGAGGSFHFMTTFTPRASNFIPNTAPTLAGISNQVVNLGRLLSLTAVANDAEAPPQTLVFSLDPGAPAGAAINPFSGIFTWTPVQLPLPNTNSIVVRVTDNGSPALSAVRSFTVTVIGDPKVSSFTINPAGTATLTWQSFPGRTYRVQFTDSLSSPEWTGLGPDIIANSPVSSAIFSIDATPQRFYRILQVD